MPRAIGGLLICLKVTQCSTSENGDAPLYNSCSLPIQVMTTGPLQAPSKFKSGRFNVPRVMKNKVSGYGYGLWCGFKKGPYQATSHIRSRLESQHQSVPWCAEECGDPLVQSGGRWQTLSVAASLGAGPQIQRDPCLASEGVLRFCTLLSLAPSSPDLDYFVWSYVENITNMTSHDTKASLIAAICRVFAELPPALVEKTCSQFRIGIEAVIEAWKRVYWIDVSSTNIIKLPELFFFQKKF